MSERASDHSGPHSQILIHSILIRRSGNKPRAPFGFAFLELADPDSGASIKDGNHTISSYKLLDNMSKGGMVIPKYLQQKAKLQTRTFRSGLSKQEENFRLKTTMCSTKKTQNGTLHDLMNWRQLEPAHLDKVIKSCLGQTTGSIGLSQHEIFKFLREVSEADRIGAGGGGCCGNVLN